MQLLVLLLVFCVVLLICWCLNGKQTEEAFRVPAKDINAAIIFACYHIDKYDYEFVKRWHKTATFYVVVNGDSTEWDQKVKSLDNVRYAIRENEGYDVGAWKDAMKRWGNELKNYDTVVFSNNSCIYALDLRDFLTKADGYDMYGLYPHSRVKYALLRVFDKKFRFLHTYFIAIGKSLYNSKDFKDYWDDLPVIKTHDEACVRHECRFSDYFDALGYRIGVYIYPVKAEWVYDDDPRQDNAPYKREFVKRKADDSTIKRFVESVYKRRQ